MAVAKAGPSRFRRSGSGPLHLSRRTSFVSIALIARTGLTLGNDLTFQFRSIAQRSRQQMRNRTGLLRASLEFGQRHAHRRLLIERLTVYRHPIGVEQVGDNVPVIFGSETGGLIRR